MVFTTQCGLLFATDYYYDGHGNSKYSKSSIGDISSWGPERRAADFPVCEQCGLSTVPTTPIQYVEQNDSSRTECRNQSIFEGYHAKNYCACVTGLFPFGSNWGDVPTIATYQRQ